MPLHKIVRLKRTGKGAVLMRKRGGINAIVKMKENDDAPYKDSVKIIGGRLNKKLNITKKGYIKI
jgi:hypothetical protein